jgi:hypothetical protein
MACGVDQHHQNAKVYASRPSTRMLGADGCVYVTLVNMDVMVLSKVGVKGTYLVVVSQQIMWIFGRETWFCWEVYKYRRSLPRNNHRYRFQGSVRHAEFARDDRMESMSMVKC